MIEEDFFLNIEKFSNSTKLNGSSFFDRSFKNDPLKELNNYILSFASQKSYIEIEGGINNWCRELEYPYIFAQISKYINKRFSDKDNQKINIFDNACGYTAVSALLAKAGLHIQGSDLIDYGERWSGFIKPIKGSMKFEKANSEDLPFEDGQFDISFSLSSIEHMSNPQKAIKEMIRVTKKNGLILFTTDIAEGIHQNTNWNINQTNFEDLINLLNKDCKFFAEPKLTHPDDCINKFDDAIKTSVIRRKISKIVHKIKNKEYPINFYVFGGAWLKR